MLRPKLRNKYLIDKSEKARLLYKKQRNVCVFLMKKAKEEYYENLDLQNVTDTKRFWKIVKPVFGNKVKTCNTISLIEKSAVITSEKALAKTFNRFFVNIVPNLDIDAYNVSEISASDTNSLASMIEKYKYLPSITAIKNHMDKIEKANFSFNKITKPFVIKELKNFDPKKTSQSNDIPTKLIKEYSEIFATIIVEDFTKCMHNGTFPKSFKISEAIPFYRKDEP